MIGQAVFRTVQDREILDAPLFLLSWGRDAAALAASVKKAGLAAPLVLQETTAGLRLICGQRRRQALRDAGLNQFPSFILPASLSERELLVLALEENLGHRDFNEAEKVLALAQLSKHFSSAELTGRWLARLGLPPREEYLERYLSLEKLGQAGLDALAAGTLDPETGARLAGLPADDLGPVVAMLESLQPGLNKRRQIITWLEEISRRETLSLRAVLALPELSAIISRAGLNRPQKEAEVREWLRRRRYPQLTAMEDRRNTLLKALNLPDRVSLQTPPGFEGLDFALQLTFRDAAEISRQLQALRAVAENPALAELVELG